MSKDANRLRDNVRQWVQQQWVQQGLDGEQLLASLQTGCGGMLKQAPETAMAAILQPLDENLQAQQGRRGTGPPPLPKADKRAAPPRGEVLLARVSEALERLIQLVGSPEQTAESARAGSQTLQSGSTSVPGLLNDLLRKAADALGQKFEQKLAELAVNLIEHPQFRLAGAEEAIRQFSATLEQVLDHHEPLLREYQERTAALFEHLMSVVAKQGLDQQAVSSSWFGPFARRSARAMRLPGRRCSSCCGPMPGVVTRVWCFSTPRRCT
jgi:hypothetical protein